MSVKVEGTSRKSYMSTSPIRSRLVLDIVEDVLDSDGGGGAGFVSFTAVQQLPSRGGVEEIA